MMRVKVATPQTILNYAAYLEGQVNAPFVCVFSFDNIDFVSCVFVCFSRIGRKHFRCFVFQSFARIERRIQHFIQKTKGV